MKIVTAQKPGGNPEKIVSAMRAEFRALAEARGRDPAIAEAMVDESLGVDGLAAKGQLVTLATQQAIEREYAEGTAESFDAVLASLELAGAEVELVPLEQRERRLKAALATVKAEYDFVLIDCPPSLSLLTLNGLCSAHGVIVPMQCEYFALEGLSDLVNTT